MRGSRGGIGGPLKNHKASKPAFNVGPSLAHQQFTILFRWQADDGPILVVFRSTHHLKLNIVKVGPPLKKLS